MAKKKAVEVETAASVEAVTEAKPKRAAAEDRATEMAGITKAIMSEMLPALMVAMKPVEAPATSRQAKVREVICRVCLQKGPGKPPCNGEHISMVVFPVKYPRFGAWFPGCIINGVRYLSSDRRQRILVPKACEGQIIKQISDYEENEMDMSQGRVAQHNSGDIGETGSRVTPATASSGWR